MNDIPNERSQRVLLEYVTFCLIFHLHIVNLHNLCIKCDIFRNRTYNYVFYFDMLLYILIIHVSIESHICMTQEKYNRVVRLIT